MKSTMRIVCAMLTLVLGLSLGVWAGDQAAKDVSQHALMALGHSSALNVSGQIQHNVKGDALHFVCKTKNLAAGAEYTLTCCERVVTTGKSNADGNLDIMSSITDTEFLKFIAENPTRRFDLWRGNCRLARSEKIFEFVYQP